jgi:ferric-dicitrate binding protein FerR (iron transport regulator)
MEKAVLIRYLAGDATAEEKAGVVQWLDAGPENMREYLALRKLFDITLWQDANQQSEFKTAETDIRKPLIRKMLTELVKIAAILLIGFLIFRVFYTPEPSSPVVMQTVKVPAGQRAEVTLADGSQVWLNANTTFTFPNYFKDSKREVTIQGEGYFTVSRLKDQPFIVNTGKYDVRVHGTEFNVLAYSGTNDFEVSLLKGSIEVYNPVTGNGMVVYPDQKVFLRYNRLVTSSITHPGYFLWKEGIISFDNEAFPDLVRKLELFFDVKINVENNKILSYRCTGKFRSKDGVEHVLKVLQLSNKFNYSIDDKKNLITIR